VCRCPRVGDVGAAADRRSLNRAGRAASSRRLAFLDQWPELSPRPVVSLVQQPSKRYLMMSIHRQLLINQRPRWFCKKKKKKKKNCQQLGGNFNDNNKMSTRLFGAPLDDAGQTFVENALAFLAKSKGLQNVERPSISFYSLVVVV
jgi:hypothetical protein